MGDGADLVLPERAASEGGSSQAVLLARRAPTIRQWSLDARSEGQPGYSLLGKQGAPIKPCWTVAVWPALSPNARFDSWYACSATPTCAVLGEGGRADVW